ncbi:MAG: hypothetical protein MPJ24_05730 [Pirellulaceae bacterium]|nr:hypothetical protein [Pirellulaceae bacterium]
MSKTIIHKDLFSKEFAVFALLVSLGVGGRLFFKYTLEIPNFTPVASLALFGGYYFRNRLWAVLLPLTIMAISNLVIGGYNSLVVMLTVYSFLLLPIVFRGYLRTTFRFKKGAFKKAAVSFGGLVGCSMAMSLLFFLTTNFAVWAVGTSHYPMTSSGLWACYANAVPFFRATLASNLIFSLGIFGSYALTYSLARETANPPLREITSS